MNSEYEKYKDIMKRSAESDEAKQIALFIGTMGEEGNPPSYYFDFLAAPILNMSVPALMDYPGKDELIVKALSTKSDDLECSFALKRFLENSEVKGETE